MAKAKKLPSGSWRCRVYSHSIPVFDSNGNPIIDPETKKQKMQRIYESFTSTDPSPAGKREAEFMAAEFAQNKQRRANVKNLTLSEAIDKYVADSINLLSPSTISGYKKIKKWAFVELMDMPLSKITEDTLRSAVNRECRRKKRDRNGNPLEETISSKTVKNEYGLVSAVINQYAPGIDTSSVKLPEVPEKLKELVEPADIMRIVKGTDVELPVLLAMWLSFTMSEVRGLTKSKSLHGDYITIEGVTLTIDGKDVEKELAKNKKRNRTHKVPAYIMELINQTDPSEDRIVPMKELTIRKKFQRLLSDNNLPKMTFHDLRHVNASVMELLHIPDKYAQDRGGWKSNNVLKRTYTHTFTTERQTFDTLIDNYYESLMHHEMHHESQKSQ